MTKNSLKTSNPLQNVKFQPFYKNPKKCYAISHYILTVHIFLMLVFDKGISTGLCTIRVVDHDNFFNWTKYFKLSS